VLESSTGLFREETGGDAVSRRGVAWLRFAAMTASAPVLHAVKYL